MDATGAALVHALEPYGLPALILSGVIVAVFFVWMTKIIPYNQSMKEREQDREDKRMQAQIELDQKREEREAAEAKARMERDVERGKTEGRWVEAMERGNAASEASTSETRAMRLQLEVLVDEIRESRTGSKALQKESATNSKKLDDIYGMLNKRSA